MAPLAHLDRLGLSRLLNLTDGVIGQRFDTIVLITPNDPLARLHPAVSRALCYWTEIEFGPYSRREANAWLAERRAETQVDGNETLLFAAERRAVPAPTRRVGFA